MKQLIEEYRYGGAGYKPCLITKNWQAALLNYTGEQGYKRMDNMEKHTETDEVFVLLEGHAILIAADKEDDKITFEAKALQKGIIYNIPQGVWHNIAMGEDARILIFEDAGTHLNDCTHSCLSDEQQKELYSILEQIIIQND